MNIQRFGGFLWAASPSGALLRTFVASFILITVLGCGGGNAESGSSPNNHFDSPEAAGNALFEKLVAKDKAGLQALVISIEDFGKVMEASAMPEAEKEKYKTQMETFARQFGQIFENSWTTTMQEFGVRAQDFKTIEKLGIHVQKDTRDGAEKAAIKIRLKAGESEFGIECSVLKLGSAWLLGPGFRAGA